jgi:hypothetical protein
MPDCSIKRREFEFGLVAGSFSEFSDGEAAVLRVVFNDQCG